MAAEDALDIFGGDPFGRDYLYGLSTGRDGQGLAPYGFRYAESVNQPTTAKGRGYLGNVGTMQDPMTELSASSDFGGRTVRYPLIVPTLTADELNLLRSGGEPTQEIYGKAQQYALGRLSRGQDPFATTQDLRYPQPQAVDTRPYDQMQASPRGFTSGLFSDVLGRTLNMPSLPRTGIPSLDLLYANRNPVLNMMGVGDVQKTAERISYGQPLTTGSGMTLKPREEAIFAGMAVAPFVGEAVNLGARAGRAGARMVGERIAENVTMGRPNLPSMLAEPRSSLFAVEPSALMPKPQAPVSELGFYSAAEQAALNLPRNKGTGQSFLNDLMKAPDVKKDELSWIGLDDFLKDKPNVTKQEVQDFIASNKIDLQEVRLGGDLSPELQTTRDALNDKYKGLVDNIADAKSQFEEGKISYGQLRNTVSNNQIQIQALDTQINEINKTIPPTKHPRWQLAGGENYREILLKLPNKAMEESAAAEMHYRNFIQKGGEPNWAELPVETQQSIINSIPSVYKNLSASPEYRSSHFDEPNILAHIRVNDRVDADGKKMLLVEELQSDWHQAGRESGYAPKNAEAQLAASKDRMAERGNEIRAISSRMAALNDSQLDEFNALAQERQRLQDLQGEETDWGNRIYDAKNSGVPDAPFKDTWYQLSLKRILKYAADNGYERVGLTTGKQQIDRFSNELRQNVDEITFQTGLKLTPSEAAELQALRSQQTYMTGTERARYEYLSSNEGEYVGKGETKIKAFKGSKPTFSGTVKDGKFIDGQAQGKTVEEVLGKTMAKQIAEKQTGVLKGDNLTVGGEGMKKYYDEIYPKFLEKYGKKWDASVGETKVNTVKERAENSMIPIMGQEPVRYIDITPKMKEGVKKGQPLAAAEQTPEMLASGGLDYADPFRNPLLESSIG